MARSLGRECGRRGWRRSRVGEGRCGRSHVGGGVNESIVSALSSCLPLVVVIVRAQLLTLDARSFTAHKDIDHTERIPNLPIPIYRRPCSNSTCNLLASVSTNYGGREKDMDGLYTGHRGCHAHHPRRSPLSIIRSILMQLLLLFYGFLVLLRRGILTRRGCGRTRRPARRVAARRTTPLPPRLVRLPTRPLAPTLLLTTRLLDQPPARLDVLTPSPLEALRQPRRHPSLPPPYLRRWRC